jgi:PIN domain nuclease of toxin-antitoxin system
MNTAAEPASRLLLDTHAFLWLAGGDPRAGERIRARLEDPSLELLLSVASVWEMAIKKSLGKLVLEIPLGQLLEGQLDAMGLQILDVELEHAIAVEQLAWHHRDPFDRLLVAQAIIERLPIVSADPAFDPYPVERVWSSDSAAG